MNDLNQTIIISSIAVITILLTIIGIQVALIFRELRRSLEKINDILDDAGTISGSISHSVKDLSSVTEVFKLAGKLLRVATGGKRNKS